MAVCTAHGGEVRVHSTPGQGTCFQVELPLASDLQSAAGTLELRLGPVLWLTPGCAVVIEGRFEPVAPGYEGRQKIKIGLGEH